jgi:hypothetical protein
MIVVSVVERSRAIVGVLRLDDIECVQQKEPRKQSDEDARDDREHLFSRLHLMDTTSLPA